jgi:hypothetical protein
MPPRKSTSAKGKQPQAQSQSQPVASSSKVTLDALPPPNIPDNLTPDFQPNKRVKTTLLAEERAVLIHEVRRARAHSTMLDQADVYSSSDSPRLAPC